MTAISLVTVKKVLTLYKNNEPAKNIELLQFKENGFENVSQKGLYKPGDKVFFIQPGYCIHYISSLIDYIYPNGDESKSDLGIIEGKPRRVRAKKFNFHRGDGIPIYSNGILLSFNDLISYYENTTIVRFSKKAFINLLKNKSYENIKRYIVAIGNSLGLYKYEEPEKYSNDDELISSSKSEYPVGIYKTNELDNIHNLWNNIKFPITLIGTEKIDGIPITIGIKNGEGFICSKRMKKPLYYDIPVGERKPNMIDYIRKLFDENAYIDLSIYKTIEIDNIFTKYGKTYLNYLLSLNFDDIILRGELNGKDIKYLDNKNSPANKEEPNIKFFDIDYIINGKAQKQPWDFLTQSPTLRNLPTVKEIFRMTFVSKEQLMKVCDNYFSNHYIEGIVVKSLDNLFNAKIINNKYDSEK